MAEWRDIKTAPRDEPIEIKYANGKVLTGCRPVGPVDVDEVVGGVAFDPGWIPTHWRPTE